MATHHILKDGTSYAIKGGTDLVNGTKHLFFRNATTTATKGARAV